MYFLVLAQTQAQQNQGTCFFLYFFALMQRPAQQNAGTVAQAQCTVQYSSTMNGSLVQVRKEFT
jgi:hypothetical protein